MMLMLGYVSAFLMGIPLAIFGSGGSILTVPILVYLFGVPPTLATGYSLVVVGLTALVGVITYQRKGLVHWRVVSLFGSASMAGAFVSRRFLLPRIPETIIEWNALTVGRDSVIMALFGILMLGSAIRMIRSRETSEESNPGSTKPGILFPMGVFVGLLTGLVGAGGGFLIIPALVLYARTPMKLSVATSLAIIAGNSLFGVLGDLGRVSAMDFAFLGKFLIASLAGMLVGSLGARHLPTKRLKPAFGSFLVLMGTVVLWKTFLV